MEPRPLRDLIVGLFVMAGLAALGYLSLSLGGATLEKKPSIDLHALFDETAGLKPRSKVVIGGVKIGEVTAMTLEKDYRVRVNMAIDSGVAIPEDSFASIFTEGVLGDRYVAIQPGGSETNLKTGEAIGHTESAVVLERLIGKLVYGLTKSGEKADDKSDQKSGKSDAATEPGK
jgi:phospholipid/cholesterol/gamma-HCH transport system substrate-binding protein